LAIASASTVHPLSDITSVIGTLTVTSLYPDAAAAPVLVAITYPATYDSSATTLASFDITGSATFTANNTVVGGHVTLTNGGDSVSIDFSTTGVVGTTATFGSTGNYLKLVNSGSYAVSVTLLTATLSTYAASLSTAFTAVTATPYVVPALTAFNLVSPQTGGCDANSCTGSLNGSVTLTPGRVLSQWTTYMRSTHASTGVLFYSTATLTAGFADFNQDTSTKISVAVGGVVDGVWTAQNSGSSIDTVIPQNDNLVLSGQLYENAQRYTLFNEAAVGAKQASVKLTSGSTDVTAPLCTAVTISPTTLTTISNAIDATITVTCTDEASGSGLWTSGYFGTVSITNGNAGTSGISGFVSGVGNTATQAVYPYISGSITIVGVFAIDNAGNAALYGSCGGNAGFDSLGCAGGSSSSASTVALSLFSVLLAVILLLA